jgi:predicted outer membrane repeat protein
MKTNLRFLLSCFLVSFGLFAGTVTAADWYVKANASGTGSSWDDACNISVLTGSPAGLASGDVVHVAAGDYTRSTQLSITHYVTILGGYPANATGTDLTGRNYTTNITRFIPSEGGTSRCFNINAGTASSGNKVILDGLTIDGFTMATGNAGTALSITSAQADIEIKNCEFKNNLSLNANGGAINMASFAYNIPITFDNCTFTNNQANWTTANGYGGAAYFNNGSTAKTINFSKCNFKNNTAYGRGGALYFTSVISCNITDCYFDSNYSSNTTDNYSNGNGGLIYVAGGTASNTFNLTRTVIVNSSGTAKGSVIWFNATPKNYLNLNHCSLIGNYAKRTSSARAAIDADNLTTNIEVTINNSVLSNYNWSGGAKTSNRADLIFLSAPTSNATTTSFTNSILNGIYFLTGNALDAVSPEVLYTTTGYLADSTINLALVGDLKITNKIWFKKAFSSENTGSYVHSQIFDVKQKMGYPMTLVATIPSGLILRVDGTDYLAGTDVSIEIPVSATDPVITVLSDNTTGMHSTTDSGLKVLMQQGNTILTGIEQGNLITIYNTSGQVISQAVARENQYLIEGNGMVIVKVQKGDHTHVVKAFIQ